MKAHSHIKLALLTALLLMAPWVWAQDGLEGALPQANLGRPFHQNLAAADLDGDNKPDGAVLIESGWLAHSSLRTIELHFSGRANTNLSFESNQDELAISVQDVNRDGAADIIVEQAISHKRIQIWLNDGRGTFRKVNTEDYPSVDKGNQAQADTPNQRPDPSPISVPPQRGPVTAILTTCGSRHTPSATCARAPCVTPQIVSVALSGISSRAPPFTFPL
jgi:hypothetical protein